MKLAYAAIGVCCMATGCGNLHAQSHSGALTRSPEFVEPLPAAVSVSPEMTWLREIVLQVLMRQPELAQAMAENRYAMARLREVKAGVLPQVSLSSSVGQENQQLVTQNRTNRYADQYSLQLRLNQPLLDSAIVARTRQAKAQVWSSDWSLVAIQEQTMLRTVELYAELVRQSRLTELARDNLRLHRQYVAQVKEIARLDLGRASDLPVAESRVALAESVLTGRLSRLDAARVQWRNHSTLPSPDEGVHVALSSALRDLPQVDFPTSMDAAIQDALEVHPQLQKALADLRTAYAGMEVASAASDPRVVAEISNRNANNYGGVFGEQRTWFAGVSLQWSLSAVDRASRRTASEATRVAQETVDVQVFRVRSAVETQWFELQAALASLTSYRKYAKQAESVAASYAEQFRIGRRSLLDVLNAENELFTARSNAMTTTMDVQVAAWRLLALRGLLAEELGL